MRILMLGWEFPPFIAGGLGVACYGLTKALDKVGHEVSFVLPKPVEQGAPTHVRVMSPTNPGAPADMAAQAAGSTGGGVRFIQPMPQAFAAPSRAEGFERATFQGVPAAFSSPYPDFDTARFIKLSDPHAPQNLQTATIAGSSTASAAANTTGAAGAPADGVSAQPAPALTPRPTSMFTPSDGEPTYGLDLIADAERYARLVVTLTQGQTFDVVHAHDWLTYPAGIALAKVTGKPLLVHVHSTEFDRAGNNVNQRVFDIERAGMQAADRVIAVSQFTKSICVRRYGIAPNKIDVVYNGVERETTQPAPGQRIEANDKVVLFLGRITMQKGPEYFIAAAKRVLEKMDGVKFVLAGSGDMALRMIELAASMGIGHKVLFTGFLRGKDVEKVFNMADCYVMPSVSEPFGIAALEAINHDVPVIISKTSGASEVLRHVLKVDFWDVDEMANKIVAVLKHPPLSKTLREQGAMELHRLTWDEAAKRCVESYARAVESRVSARA